jgi:hypothetical protein
MNTFFGFQKTFDHLLISAISLEKQTSAFCELFEEKKTLSFPPYCVHILYTY